MVTQVEFLEDLQLAYAKILIAIFTHLTHYDDGGCDYDQVGYRKTFIYNNVFVIYQPIDPDNGWIEDGCILMMPTKESGVNMTSSISSRASDLFHEVENKFIDSYNGFVGKYGHWIEAVPEAKALKPQTFQNITSIHTPISFDGKNFKMKWHIKALWEGPTYVWNPKELINWMYTLPAYKRYNENIINRHLEVLQKDLIEHQSIFNENLEKMKDYNKVQKFVDIKDEKIKLAKEIDIQNTMTIDKKKYIQNLKNSLREKNYQKESNTSYIEDEEERLPKWFKEQSNPDTKFYMNMDSQKMIAKVLSYEEAFPERVRLCGKKRKLE
jgi:hypothetical protein